MSRPSHPSLEDVDEHTFAYILSIYPDVSSSFYGEKVKGNTEKHTQACEDDEWRYNELLTEVESRSEESGLSKNELERLVRWKITHQTFRPFLLPQIRKNDREVVDQCTAAARDILRSIETSPKKTGVAGSSRDRIRRALNKVCELTGVGPATDELYAWLLPQSVAKLKYNAKEYFDMLNRFSEINMERDKAGWASNPTAKCYEKVAFVCKHWNHVDDQYKQEIERLVDRHIDQPRDQTSKPDSLGIGTSNPKEKSRTASETETRAMKRKTGGTEVQNSSPRRSKRIKK